MSSREPFLESAHLCHRLQNQLCMPASVLLEGPASSDSPRSLPNRLPLRGNEQSLPRQGRIRSSRLAADPTDPHPRSNSPVKCSSTWDCIPALPLKSCGGLGQITRLSPLPPVNGIVLLGIIPQAWRAEKHLAVRIMNLSQGLHFLAVWPRHSLSLSDHFFFFFLQKQKWEEWCLKGLS